MSAPVFVKRLPAALFLGCSLALAWLALDRFVLSTPPAPDAGTDAPAPTGLAADAAPSMARENDAWTASRASRSAPAPTTGPTPAGARADGAAHDWRLSGGSVTAYLQDFAAGHPPTTQPLDKPVPVLAAKRGLTYAEERRQAMARVREQALAEQSDAAWAALNYEPEFQMDAMTGLRVNDPEASDFLATHGLEQGDVIKSVNALRVDSMHAAASAVTTMAAADRLELVIERGSRTMTLIVDKRLRDGDPPAR